MVPTNYRGFLQHLQVGRWEGGVTDGRWCWLCLAGSSWLPQQLGRRPGRASRRKSGIFLFFFFLILSDSVGLCVVIWLGLPALPRCPAKQSSSKAAKRRMHRPPNRADSDN